MTRIALYYYWNELPLVRELDEDTYSQSKLDRQNIRHEILQLLRKGMIDPQFHMHNHGKRHCLNAHEILVAINAEKAEENHVTIQNIHFHLNKLIDLGMVQVATTLIEGNHKVRYFGRTHKWFRRKERDVKVQFKEVLPRIEKLVLHKQPSIDVSAVHHLLDQLISKQSKLRTTLYRWIEKNYDDLYQQGIDLNNFVLFNKLICSGDDEYRALSKQLSTYLGIDFEEDVTSLEK